jgi:hypothetical protein
MVLRILNVAHQDWRWLRGVPKIRMLKEPRQRVRFLRRDEANRLMATLASHMKPIVQFALAALESVRGVAWQKRSERCFVCATFDQLSTWENPQVPD